MKTVWGAFALAMLFVPVPGVQAAGGPLEWWGPRDLDEGYHIRVPVSVSNPHDFPVTNAPVAAELDLAALLVEAGWTKAAGGDRDLLSGFHFDRDSVRVVSMTNLLPADNVNGRLKVADDTFLRDDDRRYEVPSMLFEGSLSRRADFDATVNPLVTVVWRVAGTLQPAETRAFVVYFDSDRTAEPKAPRPTDLTLADGDLQSLFWSGPTVNAFGYVRPLPGSPGRIQVTAVHDHTTIQVLVAPVGGVGSAAAPLQPLPSGSTFQLVAAQDTVQVPVSTTGPVVVQVLSNKPVVAEGISMGFIPALDGGMTGRDFLFRTTTPLQLGQDVLYVTAVDPRDDDGLLEPTTVEVSALPNGPVLTFRTGDDTNPFNYAATARAGIDSAAANCWGDPPSPTITDNTPSHERLYRARVKSGERVMLQLLPVGGLSQTPSAIGAPAGTEFWAAGPWSYLTFRLGECTVRTQPAAWMASATQAGTANVTSPEVGYQLSPPGSPSPPGPPQGRYPPAQEVPAVPAFSPGSILARRLATDRPVLTQASTPTWLFTGNNPAILEDGIASNGPPQVHGPFGGTGGGRHFAGLGRSVVFAPFQGTVVQTNNLYFQGTDTKVLNMAMGSYGILDDKAAANPLRSFELVANRPVMVNPIGLVSSGFFSGVPAMLAAAPGKAEYRGYLVDLASEEGLDPLTGSTAPGVPATYKLRLNNRGHALDGSPLADVVQLTAQLPAGWSASVDGIAVLPTQGPTLSLAGSDSRALTLVVTPPADLASGSSGSVRLLASSQNNDRVSDALDVVTYVKTVFDVGLWFDAIGGPKEQENRTMSADGLARFTLLVQNQGSRPETVRLSTKFKLGETTWLANLGGADGDTQMEIPLGALGCRAGTKPCDQAKVPLTMQAPPGLVDGEATVVVVAEIIGVTGSQDAVQATAARRAPADLVLEPDGLTRFVDPGGNATFNLTLRNRGAGDANVLLGSRASPVPAWASPTVLVAGTPRADISVDKNGGLVRLQVVVPSKATALAGQATTIRFSARPEGSTSGALEAVLYATINPVHRVDATLPNLPIGLVAGDNASFEVRLSNHGNLDERFLIRTADLPAGWSFDAPRDILVPRNATPTLRLSVTVPPGEPPTAHNVTVDLIAYDGNVTRLNIPVEVGLGARSSAAATTPRTAQPGRMARVEVPVANEGNTPLTVSVTRATGETWDLATTPPLLLAPGERSSIALSWLVPANAPDGASVHRAVLTFTAQGLDEVRTEAIPTSFDVGRADLRIQEVRSVAAPAGTLVQATVTNAGTRPALGFAIDLVVDGVGLDRVPVGELAAGETVEVALLQGQPGLARVMLDANGTVVESDESNNELEVPDSGTRDAPGLEIFSALVLLVLAASLRRRRLP